MVARLHIDDELLSLYRGAYPSKSPTVTKRLFMIDVEFRSDGIDSQALRASLVELYKNEPDVEAEEIAQFASDFRTVDDIEGVSRSVKKFAQTGRTDDWTGTWGEVTVAARLRENGADVQEMEVTWNGNEYDIVTSNKLVEVKGGDVSNLDPDDLDQQLQKYEQYQSQTHPNKEIVVYLPSKPEDEIIQVLEKYGADYKIYTDTEE